ncbi:hypothetical protein, partial [Escherichia coli]|uniref:hypothetical protein n=1 Tax=Escherichia coli TaxID=562 RepID=UPI001BDDC08F
DKDDHDTWCRVPPGEFSLVPLNPRILVSGSSETTAHQSPLRTGGFTMQDFFNKRSACQATVN